MYRIALALLALSGVAQAQDSKIVAQERAGSWSYMASIHPKKGLLCAALTNVGTDNRSLMVKRSLTSAVFVQLYKDEWQFKQEKKIRFDIKLDNTVFSLDGETSTLNDGHFIEAYPEPESLTAFSTALREAHTLQIVFPNSNEATWNGSMRGSAKIATLFGQCMLVQENLKEKEQRQSDPFPNAPPATSTTPGGGA